VLSVHFCFGLAPHLGQRTDNIRPNVSFSLFTPILFSINNWIDGQFCSLDFNCPKAGTQNGTDQGVQMRDANFVTPQQHDV